MRVPLSWLKEYVEIDATPEEIADRLTLAGLEVSAIDYIGVEAPAGSPWAPDLSGAEPPEYIPWDAERVLVGELIDVQQHPNADRLTVPTVGYGGDRTITVVTGAPNIKVGMRGQKVALALGGARLIDGHSDTRKWITLKPTKLRGVPSEGMVCSELELGLSDEHEGILFLPDDAPVGTPLRDYLGDVVLDIDLTPNLGRALSIVGVAREVAAIFGAKLTIREPELQADGPSIDGRADVTIDDPADCPRFTIGLIEGVTVGPSPQWMQNRLRMIGMRPISNIVDVSNYVMMEWGQPTHAFDADLVVDRRLIVRRAKAGETLRTLDDQERKLGPEHVVVADASGPEALAGVMGGAETEVSDSTRNVLLEAAVWNTVRIRKTAQAFRLPSEASRRFERGVDPELAPIAQRRALELMRQTGGGTVAQGLIDAYPQRWQPIALELTSAEVRRLLGIELSAQTIGELLESLGFGCEVADDRVTVSVPSYRLDVTIVADLVEEVARVYGYHKLPLTRLADELPPQFTSRNQIDERFVRDTLVACGMNEVVTYRLIGPQIITAFDGTPPDLGAFVQIENPIAPEHSIMRRELLPALAEALSTNLRERGRVALFELGRVYHPQAGQPLPIEPRRLALAMAGPGVPSWHGKAGAAIDFYDLKGVLETLFDRLRLADRVRFVQSSDSRLHPGRTAAIVGPDEQAIGVIGELHPDTRERLDLEISRAVVAELDLDALLSLRSSAQYRQVHRQPAVYQDIAVIAPHSVTAEQVQGLIRQTAGPLLESVALFDVYSGAPIPEGQRSLAFRMYYRAADRTLADSDVNKIREKIARRIQHELGASVRS